MSLYTKIAPVAKSVTGAVVAGLGALGTALIADENGNVAVTAGEWVAVATATLVASYAIWQIPNEETPEQKLGAEALSEKREFEAQAELDDFEF